MALQLIVHHLIDPTVNEIRNALDVHPVVIDDAVRKNPPKSKQKQSSHLQQNTLLDFCRHSKKSSKSHRASRSRSPARESSSTTDKDRKISQTSTVATTSTTTTNGPLDKVRLLLWKLVRIVSIYF